MQTKLFFFFLLLHAGVAMGSDQFVIEIKTTNTGLYILYDAKYQLLDSIRVHTDSASIQLTHKSAAPGFYFVARDKDHKVYMNFDVFYLAAGDSLMIEETRRGWSYSGNAAALNGYAAAYNVQSKEYRGFETETPQRACEILDSVRQVRLNNIDQLARETAMPAEVRKFHHERIYHRWCMDVFNYFTWHNYYVKGEVDILPMDILPIAFRDSLRFNSAYYFTREYSDYLNAYLSHTYDQNTKHMDDQIRYHFYLQPSYQLLLSEFNGVDRHVAITSYTSMLDIMMREVEQTKFFALVDSMSAYLGQSDYHFLQYTFNARSEGLKKIAVGSIAPDFTLRDRNDQPVSLSDYRGRIIYLNFWGTWCGPCRASIPKHLELHKQYAGKDIVFLNVALEADSTNVEEWKKLIEEESYTGEHLVAEKQFNNKELIPYLLNSAPTYMIIGRRGEIIETRAEPPYKSTALIDKLLEE